MNNLNNLTFKEAVSLNNKHIKDLDNGITPATDYIYLQDLVSEYLKTDDDLPVKYIILFHLLNPNGLVNQLPKTVDDLSVTKNGKTYTNLFFASITKHRNHWVRKLNKWQYASKKPTKIQLSICLDSLQRDVNMYEEFQANKEEWFDKAVQNRETA